VTPEVARPDYDIGAVGVGIVHLGLGAFHRAHQAVYADAILRRHPGWGICGVSLKTPRMSAALAPQDGLYSLLERGTGEVVARVVGSVRELMFLGTERDRVLARIADPRVRVVSLTVTEKGYCHDPATGRINFQHPEIAHDLAHPESPESTDRRAGGGSRGASRGGRGRDQHRLLRQPSAQRAHGRGDRDRLCGGRDPSLAEWIGAHAAFPCTMVDRIVPATTDADVAEASRRLGVTDAAPVVAEPYTSWVIENRFAAARPPWEEAGATIVADVAPFETMKLRLLNGSHSTLAYLGFLSGYDFIWQASSDPLLATP
jgi:fructuronate reductase